MLASAHIEVLVARVQGERKKTLRSPLERVLAAVTRFHRGRAVPLKHVHNLLEEMFLRRGLRAGLEVEHEDRHEVAAPLEIDDAALDAEPRPMRRRRLQ